MKSPAIKRGLVEERKPPTHRNPGLDQLRGVLAFTVMLYHLVTWSGLPLALPVHRILQLAGVYFVSTFYVLSGCALLIAYGRRPCSAPVLLDFSVRRIFRIMPMFWVVTLAVFATMWAGVIAFPSTFYTTNIVLNLTGLFSWVRPHAYFSAGMWSIGNELAFYSIFPLFFLLARRPVLFGVASVMAIAGSFAWASVHMKQGVPLADQWTHYIEPMNQICFFVSGLLMGRLIIGGGILKPVFHVMMLAGGLVAFGVFSQFISSEYAVAGWFKALYFITCSLVCFGSAGWFASGWAGASLNVLGRISYSLYLVHWPVYLWVRHVLEHDNPYITVLLVGSISVLLAWITYHVIEKPGMDAGGATSRWLQTRFVTRTRPHAPTATYPETLT